MSGCFATTDTNKVFTKKQFYYLVLSAVYAEATVLLTKSITGGRKREFLLNHIP